MYSTNCKAGRNDLDRGVSWGRFCNLQPSTGSALCECAREWDRNCLPHGWISAQTWVSVSDYLSHSPSFLPNTSPLLLFVYSRIPFPSSGGRWALSSHAFTKKKGLLLYLYSSKLQTVYSACIEHRSHQWVSVQDTRHLQWPWQWCSEQHRLRVDSTPHHATLRCGRFHVWSTLKRRQRLTSGPRVQVWRGLGVDGNVLRTRKGLNIVFHTWNLTLASVTVVTP